MKKTPSIETPSGRVIFIRTPKRLSPEQLVIALASMSDDDPRWIAFHQVLDEEVATASLDATNPEASDAKMRHASGRMEGLATLKQRLNDERKKPMAAKPTRSTRR